MREPYRLIINFLVIVFFLLAFLSVDKKRKAILAAVMLLLYGIPPFLPFDPGWALAAGKVFFGLVCYLMIRRSGYL